MLAPAHAPLVLVVDDEPVVRRLMALILQDTYRLVAAADGQEALALLEVPGSEIQAVVTDIKMPNLDGLALAQAISRMQRPRPILFVTGSGDEAPRGRCLMKPFTRESLLAAVEEMFASSRGRPPGPAASRSD